MTDSSNKAGLSEVKENPFNDISDPDKAKVLADGSLYVPAMIIPMPDTISETAKKFMLNQRERKAPWEGKQVSVEFIVDAFEDLYKEMGDAAAEIYSVKIEKENIGGIDCSVILPENGVTKEDQDKTLINIVGGMGMAGVNNLAEAIPLASLLNIKVIKPHYRLLPEHPFPAGVDDVVTVYKEVLKNYDNNKVAMYGASNGGGMVLQVISKLLYLKIPAPSAIASWGGGGDYTRVGDSRVVNSNLDEASRFNPRRNISEYDNIAKSITNTGISVDRYDPLYSPIYADLSKFPPTLLAAGTRDVALSEVTLMHRALVSAKTPAELYIFEAMTHGFSFNPELPEAQELYELTANFFRKAMNFTI